MLTPKFRHKMPFLACIPIPFLRVLFKMDNFFKQRLVVSPLVLDVFQQPNCWSFIETHS